MKNVIWKREKEKKVYNIIEEKTDNYFNDLYLKTTNDMISEININDFVYREGQHNYALDIVDAIRNKKVILIQAGVGCGKSYGYLIPVFYTFNSLNGESNEKFEKIIISTSNIALQYQLIRDIDIISKELDIPITAVIAKGVNNYACIKRIERVINSRYTLESTRQELVKILEQIRALGSSDKSDLEEISKNVWRDIQLCGRGYCSNCAYTKECSFYKTEERIKNSNIIITNHANYISNVLKSETSDVDEILFSKDADMVIIDEAHKLEENLINVLENEIRLKNVFYNLDKICGFILENIPEEINVRAYIGYIEETKEKFRYLFASIKKSAIIEFNKSNNGNYAVTDGNRLSFNFTNGIEKNLNLVNENLIYLKKIVNAINVEDKKTAIKHQQILNYLDMLISIINDMLLKNNSNNIYWVSFFDEDSINLGYVVKDNSIITKQIFDKKIPIVCTSATILDGDNSYSYFRKRIGLDKIGRNIEEADEQISPFDYDNNALFYYDTTIAPPNDIDNNILDLSLKIIELIKITNGKALILFTSKQRMKEVYNLVTKETFPFKILIQNDSSVDEIRKEFESDTNSCLFATGSFWEGISIKGPSLSNLIITHLPFDNVDAINKAEASKYTTMKEKMQNVYIPDMLIKMKQAIGRLIRSDDDIGIVSCLDSRIVNYLDYIKVISPIKNMTTNIGDIISFSDEKITKKESNKHNLVLKKDNKSI